MSNAKAILALLRSHAEGDEDAFLSIALQIAAAEARQGRRTTAEELRQEVEKVRARASRGASVPIPFAHPRIRSTSLRKEPELMQAYLAALSEESRSSAKKRGHRLIGLSALQRSYAKRPTRHSLPSRPSPNASLKADRRRC